MIIEWVLILSTYQGGIAAVPMGSKQACSEAVIHIYDSHQRPDAFCLNKQTGQLIEVK